MAQDTEITILARNGTGADIWKLLTERFEVMIVRQTHSEDGETAILSLAITGKKRREDTAMTEITYRQEGDYLLPNLIPPESPNIGVWGKRRRDYLRKHQNPLYTGMLLTGTLNAHLEEIDQTATEVFDQLVERYAKREGVTEALKAQDQMEWVRRMNSIRSRVEEAIYHMFIHS